MFTFYVPLEKKYVTLDNKGLRLVSDFPSDRVETAKDAHLIMRRLKQMGDIHYVVLSDDFLRFESFSNPALMVFNARYHRALESFIGVYTSKKGELDGSLRLTLRVSDEGRVLSLYDGSGGVLAEFSIGSGGVFKSSTFSPKLDIELSRHHNKSFGRVSYLAKSVYELIMALLELESDFEMRFEPTRYKHRYVPVFVKNNYD